MSTTELILNMLAETATKDIANVSNPQGFEENKKVAKRGGNVAKVAKETLEKETGEPVVTSKNAIDFGKLISDVTKEIPNKEMMIKRNKYEIEIKNHHISGHTAFINRGCVSKNYNKY